MAKKYLLYIHNSEAFDAVENKSELINDLLAKHWGGSPEISPPTIEVDPQKILEIEETVDVPTSHSTNRITDVCKAGHPVAQGRDRCMMPGCKWSIYG